MARFDFTGWSWHEWLVRNKSAIKTIAAVALGIAAGYIAHPPLTEHLAAILAPVFALFCRFVFDLIDYWLADDPGDNGEIVFLPMFGVEDDEEDDDVGGAD